MWNTYIHATTKTVENAISRFCLVEGLSIKRKTRTNNRTGKLNWWFVIHDEEAKLRELENKWEALQTQTLWVLEKCTKPTESPENSSAIVQDPLSSASDAPTQEGDSDPNNDHQQNQNQLSESQSSTNLPATSSSPPSESD